VCSRGRSFATLTALRLTAARGLACCARCCSRANPLIRSVAAGSLFDRGTGAALRRFPHPVRILDDAVAVSFLERRVSDGLTVSVLPPRVDAMVNFYVTAFSLSDHHMRTALNEIACAR
jgi:hypothetical protein